MQDCSYEEIFDWIESLSDRYNIEIKGKTVKVLTKGDLLVARVKGDSVFESFVRLKKAIA